MAIAPLQRHVSADDIAPERLAANKTLTEKEKVAEASRQFEAILLRQILDASQKTVIQSKFADNSTANSVYRDMVTNQLADAISKSGAFGLSHIFERQLERPEADKPDHKTALATGAQNKSDKTTPAPHPVEPRAAKATQLLQ